MSTRKLGFAGRIAHYFINSKLTPLIMVFSILLGAFAVLQTPREEEPQIVVPMMDVFVRDARLDRAGSGAARHHADGKAHLGNPRRRVRLLHHAAGAQHGHRALQGGRKRRRLHHQALQQALFALRPDSPRRLEAAHQAALDRRRSHPGAHFLEQPLRQLHAAPGGQRSRS